MKETLDEQSRLGLMHYRMERADEALEEAAILSERCHYNAAVNRLYYACFYAVQALLLKHHITATTHAGVKAMLGLHFVSKGIISIAHVKLSTLFLRSVIAVIMRHSRIATRLLWMTSLRWPSHLYYK